MKTIIALALTAITFNASAFEVLAEETVKAYLNAETVIEVNSIDFEEMVQGLPSCSEAIYSKSSHVYIVKKDGAASLYVTPDTENELIKCMDL